MDYLFILILLIYVIVVAAKKSNPKKSNLSLSSIKASALLTEREKKMFFQLLRVFPSPECVILTQVSFSALLSSPRREVRAAFNRKRTDFVITDRRFCVLAILELDDSSHNGQKQRDAERDAMLKHAGYRLIRFDKIPTEKELISIKNSFH